MEKKRHEALQNKQEHGGKPTQNEKEDESELKYVEKPKQTYIIQLVQRYPEMPCELELDDNRRKQLAELMLEYPANKKKNRKTPRENKQKKTTLHMPEMQERIQYHARQTKPSCSQRRMQKDTAE